MDQPKKANQYKSIIKTYLDDSNWENQENSNNSRGYPSMFNLIAGSVIRDYTLDEHYAGDIATAHKEGWMHIHDLKSGLVAYCCGHSLQSLLKQGFKGADRSAAAPAKHLDSMLAQAANFIGTLQTEWAGAQAFNGIDTFAAPFIRHHFDKDLGRYRSLGYHEVKQAIQRFVFMLNIATRWGESPFSNITMDLTPYGDIANMDVIHGGVHKEEFGTYADYQKEMDVFNKALLEVMAEGDASGRIFTFPIITYNITEDFDWDSEIADAIIEVTAKYGLPYFNNYVSTGLSLNDTRSFCCRLSLDLRALAKKTGGTFGAGDLTGSVGVVTLNLVMLAAAADGNPAKFIQVLNKYLGLAAESLIIKRRIILHSLDSGILPYTKMYLPDKYDNHFSTIGVVGGHEACLAMFGEGIDSEGGTVWIKSVLNHIRAFLLQQQELTGNLWNLEATPAEGASYRLALCTQKKFPDAKLAGTVEVPYLTNSTNLPVSFTSQLWKAIAHQAKIQPLYTGGTIFHVFLGESPDKQACKKLVRKIVETTKLSYFSITPTFSVCPIHGYMTGKHWTCPLCI